jgi:hypothetical protein
MSAARNTLPGNRRCSANIPCRFAAAIATHARGAVLSAMPSVMTSPVNRSGADPSTRAFLPWVSAGCLLQPLRCGLRGLIHSSPDLRLSHEDVLGANDGE